MSTLISGQNQVSQGLEVLDGNMTNTILPGLYKLADGSLALNTGAKDLNTGITKLSKGSNDLNSGLLALSDGATKLSSGMAQAEDGANTLSQKLADGAQSAVAKSDSSKTEKEATMMADPIKMEDASIDRVPNYGTGFAPYFIPLALWVGALIMFLVIKINETNYAGKANRRQIAFSKFILLASIGTMQSLILDTVLIKFLHLSPNHLGLFFLLTILLSWSFIAILQFCVGVFGEVGKFFGIVLLMLQLTSAAGTFPLETAPKFFQLINPYLPMTYGVLGLREVISGDNQRIMLIQFGIILIFLLVFVLLNILSSKKIYKVSESQLFDKDKLLKENMVKA
jgi:putative membrane protein